MANSKLKEIEEKIKKYYERKKILEILKIKLKNLNNDIEDLKERIKLGKIDLNADLRAQRYNSTGSSSNITKGIEEEIEKAYLRLEKLLESKIVEAIETENKIYNISTEVKVITEALEGLTDVNDIYKEILDLRYNKNYSMKYISNKFYYGANSTAYRDLKKILSVVAPILV